MPDPKLVVITGCTRGLGRSMARGFAELGWTVAGCGTRPQAASQLAGQLGEPHLIRPCDVTDPAAVRAFAKTVIDAHGPPDLLLNNAALINQTANLWEEFVGK